MLLSTYPLTLNNCIWRQRREGKEEETLAALRHIKRWCDATNTSSVCTIKIWRQYFQQEWEWRGHKKKVIASCCGTLIEVMLRDKTQVLQRCPFKLTFSAIKYTNPGFPPVVYLVPPQDGVAVRLDPHACHGIVKYLVLFQQPQPTVVHQHPPVLAPPYLVTADNGVASSPRKWVEWKLSIKWFGCSPKKWVWVNTGWMRLGY